MRKLTPTICKSRRVQRRAPLAGSEPVKCIGVSVGVDIHNGRGVAVRVRHWADGQMDVEAVTEFKTPKAPNTGREAR